MSYPVDDLEQFGYRQELRRALRPRYLLAYGLIFMVPIAPMVRAFPLSGSVYNHVGRGIGLGVVVLAAMYLTGRRPSLSGREPSSGRSRTHKFERV